ncbi:MAG: ribosome maturation factor RimM [Gammaproteobacteria bacterium]|nr:ribosome maturation factor RimM [Gammaproteobacteria bacterium]
MSDRSAVLVGRISGIYGVRGWVKVFSYTQPRENILGYLPWQVGSEGDGWRTMKVVTGRAQGKGIVAHLEGFHDRDEVRSLIGLDIMVNRDQLPQADEDEYYWADLAGLQVETVDGVLLGKIDHLFDTGANDVVVVKGDRERLIPFVHGDVITDIDLEKGLMIVDWDPEF